MEVTSAKSLEAELLICCARTYTSSEWVERIRALLREEIDWAYLYRLAEMYGMMPLLYWHLNAASSEAYQQWSGSSGSM